MVSSGAEDDEEPETVEINLQRDSDESQVVQSASKKRKVCVLLCTAGVQTSRFRHDSSLRILPSMEPRVHIQLFLFRCY